MPKVKAGPVLVRLKDDAYLKQSYTPTRSCHAVYGVRLELGDGGGGDNGGNSGSGGGGMMMMMMMMMMTTTTVLLLLMPLMIMVLFNNLIQLNG